MSLDFNQNFNRALADVQLQSALSHALPIVIESRRRSVSSIDDWERLRQHARAIKEHTIANLDHYLAQFAAQVEQRGGKVFWAHDAADARRYITGLCIERKLRTVVKGKSMLTEEIGLNEALANANLDPIETDLGEFIVQLAGERPSHINIPAVHKTRREISDLFVKHLDAEGTDDVAELAAIARRVLRQRFASADVGITGVNFAVAETGTIALVENEGNIRMATTQPKLHVALMSIEKVIPRLSDLEVFLPLLTRSASGQKMCSYVSLLTGVKQRKGAEGPNEFHVVILDNGRTRILADEKLRESLYCVRCGACLNNCPVYQRVGGHAYGWVYPGPIGAVLTPQLIGNDRAAELPFASSLCGECRDVCPLKIDIPSMLIHLRRAAKENDAAPVNERRLFAIWAYVIKHSKRYRITMKVARMMQRALGMLEWCGLRSMRLQKLQAMAPPLAPRSFTEQWRSRSK